MIRAGAGVLLLALLAFAAPAAARTPEEACALNPSAATCIGFQKLAEAAAAECRRIGRPQSDCRLPFAKEVADDVVEAYRKTWLHTAAAFQYRLGNALPLLTAQWLGTHNSFNSVNESPTASHTDSNQQLSLTEQLDVDIRSIELDLHYVNGTVLVCHGRGPDEGNLGCTNEPPFSEVLPHVKDWLAKHPSQGVLLYLEDELGARAGYADAVKTLDEVLGPMIYKPSAAEMTDKG